MKGLIIQMIETAIDRTQGDDYCTIYTGERKFILQLKKLASEYPKEVKIKYINPDGSMLANVPYDWFRFIKPPTKRNYTEEQRKEMSKRMIKARNNKLMNKKEG